MSTSERNPRRQFGVPGPLIAFLVTLCLLTSASVAALFRTRLLNGRFRSFEPLAPPGAGFDFWVYQTRMPLAHHAAFFSQPGYPWTYPAPGALIYTALYTFTSPGKWIGGWIALLLLTLSGYAFAVYRLARSAGNAWAWPLFLLTMLCAWPVYISLQRGNIESLLFLLVAAGVWAFACGKFELAACLIGAAGACKLYPLLCFGLFVPMRQWKAMFLGASVAVGLTLGSLWYLNPDIIFAYRHISANIHLFTKLYGGGLGLGSAIYDHSLFELVKLVGRAHAGNVERWTQLYLVFAGLLSTVVFFTRVQWLPVLNQVLYLLAEAVLLPPASFDYALQSLYIPFAWITLALLQRRLRPGKTSYVLMVLFALEFAPLVIFKVRGVTINGALKGVALLLLAALAAAVPLRIDPGYPEAAA